MSGIADQLHSEIVETKARLANLMQAYQVLKNLDLAPKRRTRVVEEAAPALNGHKVRITGPLPGQKRAPHAGGSTEAIVTALADGEWHTREALEQAGIVGKVLITGLSRLVVAKLVERKGNTGAFSYRLPPRTMAERAKYDPSGSWPPKLGEKVGAKLKRGGPRNTPHGQTRELIVSRLTNEWQRSRDICKGDTAVAQMLYMMAKASDRVEVKGTKPKLFRLKAPNRAG